MGFLACHEWFPQNQANVLMSVRRFKLMVKYLADGETIDEDRDGKSPRKRSAAAKKAAETRRRQSGGKRSISLKIDGNLYSGLEKMVKIGGAKSKDDAIETAIRQYLMQNRMLVN